MGNYLIQPHGELAERRQGLHAVRDWSGATSRQGAYRNRGTKRTSLSSAGPEPPHADNGGRAAPHLLPRRVPWLWVRTRGAGNKLRMQPHPDDPPNGTRFLGNQSGSRSAIPSPIPSISVRRLISGCGVS
jgi:hypothetical protein